MIPSGIRLRREATQRQGEVGIYVAMILIAGGFAWMALLMPIGDLSLPGPGFFPLGLSALLALTALANLIRVARLRPIDPAAVVLFEPPVVLAIAAMVLASAAFEWAGFLVTFALFLAVLFRVLAQVSLMRAAVLAIVVTSGAHLLFVRALSVQLPPLPFGP